LQKIREETQSKMTQVQRESQEKTLGVLTAEQMKKLRELSEKGWPELTRAIEPRTQTAPKAGK
jgi:hypothetical protein